MFLISLYMLVSTKENILRVSDAANLFELVLAQSDLRTIDVLFKVLHRSGARDWQDNVVDTRRSDQRAGVASCLPEPCASALGGPSG